MNRFVMLILLGFGCRQSPAPSPPPVAPEVVSEPEAVLTPEQRKWEWTAHNGTAQIRQRFVAEGKCSLEGEGPAGKWSVEACLGTNLELWFASPGGDRVMTFDPTPAGADDWEFVSVVKLYERSKQVGGTNAHALVAQTRQLRRFGKRFGWLAGTAGIPGVKPHLSDDGAFVEGESSGGTQLRFGFDGSGIPAPATQRAPREPTVRYDLPPPPPNPKRPGPSSPRTTLILNDGSAAQPQRTRYYCRWKASVKTNAPRCRNDSDCNGGVCESGVCIKGGTRQAFTVDEVGGSQWEGCYAAEAAEVAIVRNECERSARAKSGESISCTCSTSPSDGCR